MSLSCNAITNEPDGNSYAVYPFDKYLFSVGIEATAWVSSISSPNQVRPGLF